MIEISVTHATLGYGDTAHQTCLWGALAMLVDNIGYGARVVAVVEAAERLEVRLTDGDSISFTGPAAQLTEILVYAENLLYGDEDNVALLKTAVDFWVCNNGLDEEMSAMVDPEGPS